MHVLQDLRYGVRQLRRSPVFALTAALSLATGIGADTAIFTLVNGLLFRAPAGVADPDRLVDITRRSDDDRLGINELSFPTFVDLRRRASSLDDVYAYEATPRPVSLAAAGGNAQRIFGHTVTTNYFAVLGVAPAAGRLFDPHDATVDGEASAIVLSHRFWDARFQRDPAIVGATVQLNGRAVTVIGVAADAFRGTSLLATDVWVPTTITPSSSSFLTRRELFWGLARGRVRPGVSIAQASAEIETIGLALAQEYPDQYRGQRLRVRATSMVPGNLAGPLAAILALVTGFVSLVLAVACANLAGLLLARATTRRREIAVRVAIGAGRARLVQQLLTETLLLFVLGGGAGLLLARLLTSLVVALLPTLPVPMDVSLALDGRIVAFTVGVSFIAALASGLAPALHATRADVVSGLKDEMPGGAAGSRLRHAFLIAQMALSIVLVAGAALFARSLQKARAVDPGFDPRGVEVVELDPSLAGYAPDTALPLVETLLDRVRVLPGVAHAAVAVALPFGGRVRFGRLSLPGASDNGRVQFVDADPNAVSPDYFATIRIPIVRGRPFTGADRDGGQLVAIVSEEAARRFWPGQDPLGKALLLNPTVMRIGQNNAPRMLVTVGVARDVRTRASDRARPLVYVPWAQHRLSRVMLIARTEAGRPIAPDIRVVVSSIDRNLAVLSTQTLEEAAWLDLLPQRIAAVVSASLGLAALLLASMGLFGVTAYSVAQRTREIGIRVALGADRGRVLRLMLRRGMRVVMVGGAIGVLASAAIGRGLTAALHGFPSIDVVVLGGAVGLFALVAVVACYLPAHRATRINAIEALRCE